MMMNLSEWPAACMELSSICNSIHLAILNRNERLTPFESFPFDFQPFCIEWMFDFLALGANVWYVADIIYISTWCSTNLPKIRTENPEIRIMYLPKWMFAKQPRKKSYMFQSVEFPFCQKLLWIIELIARIRMWNMRARKKISVKGMNCIKATKKNIEHLIWIRIIMVKHKLKKVSVKCVKPEMEIHTKSYDFGA